MELSTENTARRSILLICTKDHSLTGQLMTALEMANYEVHLMDNVEACIVWMCDQRTDYLLIDSRSDSWQHCVHTVEWFKVKFPAVKLITIIPHGDQEFEDAALKAGAFKVFPVEPEDAVPLTSGPNLDKFGIDKMGRYRKH